MALTRTFNQTVRLRAQQDPMFRRGLLCTGLASLLEGELSAGKGAIRDYINATLGFEELALRVGKSSKSLHRMFGPHGNPSSANLLAVISTLQRVDRIKLEISAADAN